MRKPILTIIIAIIILSIFLFSCSSYKYEIPEKTNDGWEIGSLENNGIDVKLLSNLVQQIKKEKIQNIHSILIIQDGELVFEEYFSGYDFDYFGEQFRGEKIDFGIYDTHDLASVTKIIASTLVGVAIDNGFIDSVNEKISKFFPEYSGLFEEEKEKITIEHLLSMTSGLKWDDESSIVDTSRRNDLVELFYVEDPIEYILSKPVIFEPGSRFHYSGGDVNLLGEVIYKATGQKIDEFSYEYLFNPLGITDYKWDYINSDIVYTSGGSKMRPRDLAKIGYLHLNEGLWQDKQMISEEWIEASIKEYIELPTSWSNHGDRYGYQWFLRSDFVNDKEVNSYLRTGWGGQRLSVYPSLDTIIVLTGGNYSTPEPVNEIVNSYILPALIRE